MTGSLEKNNNMPTESLFTISKLSKTEQLETLTNNEKVFIKAKSSLSLVESMQLTTIKQLKTGLDNNNANAKIIQIKPSNKNLNVKAFEYTPQRTAALTNNLSLVFQEISDTNYRFMAIVQQVIERLNLKKADGLSANIYDSLVLDAITINHLQFSRDETDIESAVKQRVALINKSIELFTAVKKLIAGKEIKWQQTVIDRGLLNIIERCLGSTSPEKKTANAAKIFTAFETVDKLCTNVLAQYKNLQSFEFLSSESIQELVFRAVLVNQSYLQNNSEPETIYNTVKDNIETLKLIVNEKDDGKKLSLLRSYFPIAVNQANRLIKGESERGLLNQQSDKYLLSVSKDINKFVTYQYITNHKTLINPNNRSINPYIALAATTLNIQNLPNLIVGFLSDLASRFLLNTFNEQCELVTKSWFMKGKEHLIGAEITNSNQALLTYKLSSVKPQSPKDKLQWTVTLSVLVSNIGTEQTATLEVLNYALESDNEFTKQFFKLHSQFLQVHDELQMSTDLPDHEKIAKQSLLDVLEAKWLMWSKERTTITSQMLNVYNFLQTYSHFKQCISMTNKTQTEEMAKLLEKLDIKLLSDPTGFFKQMQLPVKDLPVELHRKVSNLIINLRANSQLPSEKKLANLLLSYALQLRLLMYWSDAFFDLKDNKVDSMAAEELFLNKDRANQIYKHIFKLRNQLSENKQAQKNIDNQLKAFGVSLFSDSASTENLISKMYFTRINFILLNRPHEIRLDSVMKQVSSAALGMANSLFSSEIEKYGNTTTQNQKKLINFLSLFKKTVDTEMQRYQTLIEHYDSEADTKLVSKLKQEQTIFLERYLDASNKIIKGFQKQYARSDLAATIKSNEATLDQQQKEKKQLEEQIMTELPKLFMSNVSKYALMLDANEHTKQEQTNNLKIIDKAEISGHLSETTGNQIFIFKEDLHYAYEEYENKRKVDEGQLTDVEELKPNYRLSQLADLDLGVKTTEKTISDLEKGYTKAISASLFSLKTLNQSLIMGEKMKSSQISNIYYEKHYKQALEEAGFLENANFYLQILTSVPIELQKQRLEVNTNEVVTTAFEIFNQNPGEKDKQNLLDLITQGLKVKKVSELAEKELSRGPSYISRFADYETWLNHKGYIKGTDYKNHRFIEHYQEFLLDTGRIPDALSKKEKDSMLALILFYPIQGTKASLFTLGSIQYCFLEKISQQLCSDKNGEAHTFLQEYLIASSVDKKEYTFDFKVDKNKNLILSVTAHKFIGKTNTFDCNIEFLIKNPGKNNPEWTLSHFQVSPKNHLIRASFDIIATAESFLSENSYKSIKAYQKAIENLEIQVDAISNRVFPQYLAGKATFDEIVAKHKNQLFTKLQEKIKATNTTLSTLNETDNEKIIDNRKQLSELLYGLKNFTSDLLLTSDDNDVSKLYVKTKKNYDDNLIKLVELLETNTTAEVELFKQRWQLLTALTNTLNESIRHQVPEKNKKQKQAVQQKLANVLQQQAMKLLNTSEKVRHVVLINTAYEKTCLDLSRLMNKLVSLEVIKVNELKSKLPQTRGFLGLLWDKIKVLPRRIQSWFEVKRSDNKIKDQLEDQVTDKIVVETKDKVSEILNKKSVFSAIDNTLLGKMSKEELKAELSKIRNYFTVNYFTVNEVNSTLQTIDMGKIPQSLRPEFLRIQKAEKQILNKLESDEIIKGHVVVSINKIRPHGSTNKLDCSVTKNETNTSQIANFII